MSWGWGWRPYVPVWKRRAQAMAKMEKLRKKGVNVQPVRIDGRTIARTFWGQAWCQHLEKFSDFENRLPRGRTYVRNGSVCHLDISKGKVVAKVSGSELYDVEIGITALPAPKWKRIRQSCVGRVGTLLELLQGKLSNEVMQVVTDRDHGLFPLPKEIELDCSCPDWAEMCKHVAAVLYGVGARLDEKPELLFLLRGVDHTELVSADSARTLVTKAPQSSARVLREEQLGEVFGIDVVAAPTDAKDGEQPAATIAPPTPRRPSRQGPAAHHVTTSAPAAAKKRKPGKSRRR